MKTMLEILALSQCQEDQTMLAGEHPKLMDVFVDTKKVEEVENIPLQLNQQ